MKNKLPHLLAFFMISFGSYAQNVADSLETSMNQNLLQINGYQRILQNLEAIPNGMTLGGYAEVLYNQPESVNGEIDVQRLILLFGYKFDDRTQFVTELEFEHVKEVYIEQAFVNYSVNNSLNVRAGLMLVPMGIINEYHEPTTFNGVERPSMDNKLVPTTWREIGIGVSGRSDAMSMRYQAYIFNGFLSHNGTTGLVQGSNGLRSGRQKGAESVFRTPNLSMKLDFYGINGLRLGLSGYFGRTQAANEVFDTSGSTVGLSMIGFDARYNLRKFTARCQYITSSIKDAFEYNQLTVKDLGSGMSGYYIEGAYNLLPIRNRQRLFAFVRYENFDTHASVPSNTDRNAAYHRKEITTGLSYHLAPGAVFKMDYQSKSTGLDDDAKGQINAGVGVWF
ncbi:MAG: hypothetical protein CBC02_011200 [Flavobacteriaceae bacterium TMED42]|nr:MAG: hypothetical protein CBE26_04600 [Kiritimatiellaceae bacterium TMED266]RPG63277.1 MAG: hypothetical protein CBC02_011200 [Flavobacteriaceae bacterium TMED42]